MKSVVLERFCYSGQGVFGELYIPGAEVLATVERPWLGNKREVSCIPNGEYICRPRRYNRGGYDAYEVTNVKDRTHILFHRGNFVRNSKGCILINQEHGAHKGEWCGLNSKVAFNYFMEEMNGEPFELFICDRKGADL